jgi:hypothetical protein
MSGAILPLPQYAFMAWCSITKKSTWTILALLISFRHNILVFLRFYGPRPLTYDVFQLIFAEKPLTVHEFVQESQQEAVVWGQMLTVGCLVENVKAAASQSI